VAKILLKGNSGIFKPRPYFWHEIRLSPHREQLDDAGEVVPEPLRVQFYRYIRYMDNITHQPREN